MTIWARPRARDEDGGALRGSRIKGASESKRLANFGRDVHEGLGGPGCGELRLWFESQNDRDAFASPRMEIVPSFGALFARRMAAGPVARRWLAGVL
jgi:hypothetical protein